jgi:stearoyl-CoA desaturase (delta-9 desaturase)
MSNRQPPALPALPALSKIDRASGALGRLAGTLLVAMHLAVLLVFVTPFSWSLVALAIGSYVFRMWAVTTGYHRYLAHRSFKTSRAFQLVLAVLGATTMQGGPLWWTATHRRHHRFSDQPGDVHSPVQRGFFYAHIGWLYDRHSNVERGDEAKDLSRFPELRFVDRHEWLPLLGWAGLCYAIAGWPGIVWGFFVSTIALLHGTFLINSLAHVWGSRRYETRDQSRNNALLALLTLGEGWHNNHHHFMSSARQGFFWWEIDVSYYVIKLLERLGLVWDVREPTAAALAPTALGRAHVAHVAPVAPVARVAHVAHNANALTTLGGR